jgi:flotillin
MMTEMLIKVLPEFAKAVSDPIGKVESIRILDSGNGKGMNNIPASVTGIMTNLQESLSQMTGLDLNEVIDNLSGGKGSLREELKATPAPEANESEPPHEATTEKTQDEVAASQDDKDTDTE